MRPKMPQMMLTTGQDETRDGQSEAGVLWLFLVVAVVAVSSCCGCFWLWLFVAVRGCGGLWLLLVGLFQVVAVCECFWLWLFVAVSGWGRSLLLLFTFLFMLFLLRYCCCYRFRFVPIVRFVADVRFDSMSAFVLFPLHCPNCKYHIL